MLFVLAAALALDPPHVPASAEPWRDEWGTRLAEWESTLAPLHINDPNLATLIGLLDPRPTPSFRRFSGERLDACLQDESRYWFDAFFCDEANPFLNGTKLPTRYSLPGEPGRMSLLLYEWSSGMDEFAAVESSSMVLLRVKPKMAIKVAQGDVPSDQVRARTASLLRGGAAVRREGVAPFRLPESIKAGEVFTNQKDGRITWCPPNWTESIVGFYTNDGAINLLIAKVSREMQRLFVKPDEEWLPAHLRCKDSEQLLVEKLRGESRK